MPVTLRATDTTPVIAWLGSPPPAGVAESLASIATIETRWTPAARLIAVWAPAGVAQLGRLPARTRRPPVIAAVQTDPPHDERMEWIRAGADDLVSLAALPIAVARRLQSHRGHGPDPRGSHEPDPAAPIQPLGPPRRRTPTRPRSAEPPPAQRGVDAFPPLPIPPHGDAPMQGAMDWVQSVARYLPARDEWTARWGPDGLERMLELSQLRARASGGTDDLYGVAAGRPDPALGWPLLVRRAPDTGGSSIEVAEACAIATGSDGLVIELPFGTARRQKLVADLLCRPGACAQLLLETRWQRRVSADRWHLGVLLLEMRIRTLPPG